MFLQGEGAALWVRLVGSGIHDDDLKPSEREIIRDMEAMGLAADDEAHPARVRSIGVPWLESPIHELVYALLTHIADEQSIRICFIKGPTLYAQGLRERTHSGDVDCWVEPGAELRFARAVQAWGWRPAISAFTGTRVLHSLTLRASGWGCAIDVHSWFPGMSAEPADAFNVVFESAEPRIFAGVSVRTPSMPLHSIINALNEVRPSQGRMPDERQVQAAARTLLTVGDAVLNAASSVGAEYALAEPFARAFPEREFDLSNATPPDDWVWRKERSTLRAYLAALKLIPPGERTRVIYRILWPTEESLRTGPLSNATDSPTAHTLRTRRLIEGLRQIVRRESA